MIIDCLFGLYKKAISPYVGAKCKFFPTCSEYCLIAVKKYGYLQGMWKTFCRLLRCNPFSKGGVDWP